MYTFDQYLRLEVTTTYTAKQSTVDKFSTLCVNLLCNDILLMHKTCRPSTVSVLLQIKDLISEKGRRGAVSYTSDS